jgi:hypothetical protein
MSHPPLQTPVALILFKRSDTTQQVFQAIRQAQPSKLFLIADGPRSNRPQEAEACAAARAVVEQVDWDCEVFKNYSTANLGCGKRLPTGLDWVFNQVEEAIILEDDCLPHPTFFPYCEELLERYRNDTRIMTISGDNTPPGFQRQRQATDSYYFSIYPRTWGWATWRRAWQHHDFNMKQWTKIHEENWLKDILQDDRAVRCWSKILKEASGRTDVWDFQWSLASWLNSGMSIIPNGNLISNIGHGTAASNTIDMDDPRSNVPTQPMSFPLNHPSFILPDRLADAYTQEHVYHYDLYIRVKRKLLKLLKRAY